MRRVGAWPTREGGGERGGRGENKGEMTGRH